MDFELARRLSTYRIRKGWRPCRFGVSGPPEAYAIGSAEAARGPYLRTLNVTPNPASFPFGGPSLVSALLQRIHDRIDGRQTRSPRQRTSPALILCLCVALCLLPR